MSLDKDVEKVLVSEEEIKDICARLRAEISQDYKGNKLLLVSVLKGAVVVMAGLSRKAQPLMLAACLSSRTFLR